MSPFFKSRYTSLLLVVLIALFLMQRGGLLLWGYSHIAHPAFDETASGVLTCDLLDGEMRAPLFTYQYESRSGDGLIEGFLLVPFFKFFGRSLFSLKMLALLSAFLSLLCWIFFMRRYQGIWAAIIFASMFAFPPLMFARLNLMGTIASHHLINPLMAVQLLFLFRIIEGGNTRGTVWLWLGFGFLSGLGSYTFYTYIIFDTFCLLFLLLFRPGRCTVQYILLFLGGFFTGFSPWIIRFLSSPAGGSYLASLVQNSRVEMWEIFQNFGFNLPHSLGYHYPSRSIGMVSTLFCLCIVFLSGVIIKRFLCDWSSSKSRSLRDRLEYVTPATLQGVYFIIFPFFFLVCLSLSPMKIMPFEYWPTIGFFGYFSVADVYRYRWLHLLFPFYFAIISVGMSILLTATHGTPAYKRCIIIPLIFFVLWSMVTSVSLYSENDFGKLFCYKGYSYERMGNRFILSDVNRLDVKKAQQFALHYPEGNRNEAYRCLGTKVVLDVLSNSHGDVKLKEWLTEIPLPYRNDFIYGIARAAQNSAQREFDTIEKIVTEVFPDTYYENWGFRHLGYKYYSLLLNQEKIRASIPPLEEWFFKHSLDTFYQGIRTHFVNAGENNLFDEISTIPFHYQPEVVRGVGKLVGAEMLFDPLLSRDYPLDSTFGEQWEGTLHDAFYEGVGSGFAETLTRFWRTLLLPDNPENPRYTERLDIEWVRSYSLMSRISPSYTARINKGFLMTLQKEHLDDGMEKYLRRELSLKQ